MGMEEDINGIFMKDTLQQNMLTTGKIAAAIAILRSMKRAGTLDDESYEESKAAIIQVIKEQHKG